MKAIYRTPVKNAIIGKGNEYLIYAIRFNEKTGFEIYIQTDNSNTPSFIDAIGFEFLTRRVPSSWVTTFKKKDNNDIMYLLPHSWNYDTFFQDINDQHPDAIVAYRKEVEIIHKEEGEPFQP